MSSEPAIRETSELAAQRVVEGIGDCSLRAGAGLFLMAA
jgi:hypothetical protein